MGSIVASAAIALNAHADLQTYALVDTYSLPGTTYDLMPDGRLLDIAADGTVSIQDSINASTYSAVGSIGQVNSAGFGPAFVSVSPDGATIAVGNNEFDSSNAVLFFDAAAATSGNASAMSSIITPNFAASWSDNDTIYVSGADGTTFDTTVNRLDMNLGTSTTVLSPAGVFSGGVTVHNGGVYAGDGDSGDVYRFDAATLDAAVSPVALTSGDFIESHESAGSIDFDADGNIIIAGGVFDFGSGGFTGSAAIFDAFSTDSQVFTPAGPDTFYGAFFNDVTGQLVVTADGTAYVFAVPSPTTAAPLLVALAACTRRRTR